MSLLNGMIIAMAENEELVPNVRAQWAIAAALIQIADKLERLGLNGASSSMGALEAVSYELKRIANGVNQLEFPPQ